MKLVVDGRNLEDLLNKKEELSGLDVMVVSFDSLDEIVLGEIRKNVASLEVETVRNSMQMLTYMKLQILRNRATVYTTDNTIMFLLNARTKNYCDDLSLTCKFIKGMIRYETYKVKSSIIHNNEIKVKGLA